MPMPSFDQSWSLRTPITLWFSNVALENPLWALKWKIMENPQSEIFPVNHVWLPKGICLHLIKNGSHSTESEASRVPATYFPVTVCRLLWTRYRSRWSRNHILQLAPGSKMCWSENVMVELKKCTYTHSNVGRICIHNICSIFYQKCWPLLWSRRLSSWLHWHPVRSSAGSARVPVRKHMLVMQKAIQGTDITRLWTSIHFQTYV